MNKKLKASLENALTIAFVPSIYLMVMAASIYGNRNEPRTGEFKKINDHQVKTTVYAGIPAGRAETYDFANDSVTQFNIVGAPRRGVFSNTKTFPFNELQDTSNLQIAREMYNNKFSFAKKMTESVRTHHTVKQIVDNKDTIETSGYYTFKDTAYIAFKR